MNPFAIARPRSFDEAGALLRDNRFALPVIKAGGMDVVDHLKEGLIEPDLLIDIQRTAKPEVSAIARQGSRLRVGARATLAQIAGSPVLGDYAPVLAQAAGSAATPQVRNVATAAGNLLQRPRCWYYRNSAFDCLKKGGATCYSVDGENRYHAVFGAGPCHIVHPSNLAPALHVLGGLVRVTGGARETIEIAGLFHMPDRGVFDEHNLEPGEVVTGIECASAPRSAFYAVKEKQSFDWPLVMAAVALELDGTRITSARICAGAVAPVPWPLPGVEEALAGVSLDDEGALRGACGLSVQGARPMSENAYKLKLLPIVVRRAVLKAAGREVEE